MLGSQDPSLPIPNENLSLTTHKTNMPNTDNRARRRGGPWCKHWKNLVITNRSVGTFIESHWIGNHKKIEVLQLLNKDN